MITFHGFDASDLAAGGIHSGCPVCKKLYFVWFWVTSPNLNLLQKLSVKE